MTLMWFGNEKNWTTQQRPRSTPANKGSWTQVANKNSKERKARAAESAKIKKQQRKDLAARKRNPLKSTPSMTAVANGANARTLARAAAKREKKATQKAMKKAERKAKGFWG